MGRERDAMRARRQRVRRERDVKILLALDMGWSVREVADAFGLSPARVCQIRAARN